MLCKKPYMAGSSTFGCGQCLPCRVNRARQWTWRQFLESLCHEQNCFVTLTYDRGNIPGNWQLTPLHLRQFVRELRRTMYPVRFRFYGVGEYGEQSFRPHYHLSLFGVSSYSRSSRGNFVDTVRQVWGRGHIKVDEFNCYTAGYVSGYITKKLLDRRDGHEWIIPEFARMSNRPGIGAGAMDVVARQLLSVYSEWREGDIPRVLHLGRRKVPLSRYLVRRLRESVGFTPSYVQEVKDEVSFARSLELQAMFETTPGVISFKEAHVKSIEGKLNQVQSRYDLYKRRTSL